MMNLASQYVYVENISDDGDLVKFNPNSEDGTLRKDTGDDGEEDTLIFSHEWNGKFTQRELDYLDGYYEELEDGFVLDNKSIKDYARKVAKASLAVDIASNKYRIGSIQSKELKEALDMFDNLSKSANFAACKRRAGDQGGLGSFGELAAKIEPTGKIQENYVVWPQDEADKLIEEYRHVVIAVGLEGGL
jgi:hypothetical protein